MSKALSKTKTTDSNSSETSRTPSSINKKALTSMRESLDIKEFSDDSQGNSLEAEIKSKQRILALLDRKIGGDALLYEQIMQRDRLIEELTARVIAAEAKAKVKSKASAVKLKEQVHKLEEDLHNSRLSRLKCDEIVAQLREETQAWKTKAQDEQEAGEFLSEALTEEVEGLKAELERRKQQTSEMKQDITQLSRIIEDMAKLNAELNAKIEEINKETSAMNSDYFAATAKANQVEQMEKELGEYIATSQFQEKQVVRLTDKLDKTNKSKLAIEAASREAQGKLKQLEGKMTELNTEAQDELRTVRHLLKQVTSEDSLASEAAAEDDVRHQLVDLKAVVKEKERQLSRDQEEIGSLNKRLSGIDSLHQKEKADWGGSMERVQKKVNVLLLQVTGFSERFDITRDELARKEIELQKSLTQQLHLKDRIDSMKAKLAEHSDRNASLERAMKDLRSTIHRIQTERFEDEKQVTKKERQTIRVLASARSMQEELFYKDSEIMRRAKETTALTRQVEELTSQLKAAPVKGRAASEEGNQECIRRLEHKDREIEMLKEMLRGAQAEVKQKGNLIARIRRRPDDMQSPTRSAKDFDADIGHRLEEFFTQTDKLSELPKKSVKARALSLALQKLQGDLEPDMKVSVHKLKELRSAEKFSRLLPGEGVISVGELVVMLRGLVSSTQAS
jgi:chromosome segregation ATPase